MDASLKRHLDTCEAPVYSSACVAVARLQCVHSCTKVFRCCGCYSNAYGCSLEITEIANSTNILQLQRSPTCSVDMTCMKLNKQIVSVHYFACCSVNTHRFPEASKRSRSSGGLSALGGASAPSPLKICIANCFNSFPSPTLNFISFIPPLHSRFSTRIDKMASQQDKSFMGMPYVNPFLPEASSSVSAAPDQRFAQDPSQWHQ